MSDNEDHEECQKNPSSKYLKPSFNVQHANDEY